MVWITHSRWLPQVEGGDAASSKFPSAKIPRFIESRRTLNATSRWSPPMAPEIVGPRPADRTQDTLAPNESEGLLIPLSCRLRKVTRIG